MKVAKFYIGKEDIKKQLGIESDDFIITNIASKYDSIEFDLVFDKEVDTSSIETVKYYDGMMILRQKLFNEKATKKEANTMNFTFLGIANKEEAEEFAKSLSKTLNSINTKDLL